MAIGQRLKSARNKKGWSQRYLGLLSGVDFTTVSNIELGKRPDPQSSTVIKLCRALGISADELLGLKEMKSMVNPTTESELKDCLENMLNLDPTDIMRMVLNIVDERRKKGSPKRRVV